MPVNLTRAPRDLEGLLEVFRSAPHGVQAADHVAGR